MISISSKDFFKLQSFFSNVPYSQSKGWFQYLKARGENLVFYIDNCEIPSIGFMGKVKSVPVLGKILLIEGEIIKKDISNKLIRDFYCEIIQLPYVGIELNSSNTYNVEFEIGIRRAGFVRPLANFSCPLTSMIDLTKPLILNKMWRKNYNKAVKSNLSFKSIDDPDMEHAKGFSELYAERASKKGLGHDLNPTGLLALIKNKDMNLFVAESSDKSIMSATIIYINGIYSYHVYVGTSQLGLLNGSSRFVLQSALVKLAEQGVEFFDFGRIPPSNHATDNIYKFKDGIRGRKVQYNGEWVYYKSKLIEYLIHFIKLFYHKSQRY